MEETKKYKIRKEETLQNDVRWEVLTPSEQQDYLNQIKHIENEYYDEFDTCRERLTMLLIALNDFYSVIAETRLEDKRREELIKQEKEGQK